MMMMLVLLMLCMVTAMVLDNMKGKEIESVESKRERERERQRKARNEPLRVWGRALATLQWVQSRHRQHEQLGASHLAGWRG